jgi:N-acetylneuraminic acid mutarotase
MLRIQEKSVCSSHASQHGLNRWVDKSTARGLVHLVLHNRNTDGSFEELPEEIITRCIPDYLHFSSPVGGMIYVLGGRASKVLEPEHYLNTAECYDTFRNEWIQLPPMMSKRVGASSIVAKDGRVFIIGGYAKHPDKPLASGECFDPRTGEWKAIAELSQGRFGHSIAACGKYLYVIGGDSRRNLVSGIERYDTENDEWKTVGLLPRPVAGGRTLESYGKLYLIGGDIGSQPLSFTNTIRVYDPSSNSWEILNQTLSQGRSATACTWLAEGSTEIAVIGGYAAENDSFFELKSSEIIQTDPQGSSISKGRVIPPLPEARAGCRAVTIGNKIYVIGGETPESSVSEGASVIAGNNSAVVSVSPRPLANVREVLLQALQQRLASTTSREGQLGSGPDADLSVRLAPVNRMQSGPVQTERKAHPVVAVFDTSKWEWEKNTPIMTTARTAASVCVGIGYPTSYGWDTQRRWMTERSADYDSMQDSMLPRRPLAASG